MKPPSTWRIGLASWLAIAGCYTGPGAPAESDVARGRDLFSSTLLSPSSDNPFSCATCHDLAGGGGFIVKTGAPLAGATLRTSFWGGQENDLLTSINDCFRNFMVAPTPLHADAPDARALYAYLESLEPGDPNPAPFTIIGAIADVPRGDAAAGQELFTRTCGACHGTMHDGLGRLADDIPTLPDDTLVDHAEFDPKTQRLIFVEKVRHGCFLGYGGFMPPFSAEVLRDADVSDLLEGLGVLGE